MNEIYVACEHHDKNSDSVFYCPHVDGLLPVWPFCHVFRGMVALNSNRQIITAFPMLSGSADGESALTDGDAVLFDYHREMHCIQNHPEHRNTDLRISLKLHYVVYPRCLKVRASVDSYFTILSELVPLSCVISIVLLKNIALPAPTLNPPSPTAAFWVLPQRPAMPLHARPSSIPSSRQTYLNREWLLASWL